MENRVKIFLRFRDMPYRLTGEEPVTCLVKCYGMQKELAKIGIDSKLALGRFCWTTLPIPPEILELVGEVEEDHVFLRVKVPEINNWVDIDPTWDSQLADVFEISKWNGIESTRLMTAMSDIRKLEISPASLLIKPLSVRTRISKRDSNFEFYSAMDHWLDGVRNRVLK